jgi:hypothetical protein
LEGTVIGFLDRWTACWMNDVKWFRKDDGRTLPVSDRYLLPYLNPTSPGTNYWDPPPSNNKEAESRGNGRILLQLHQLIDLLARATPTLKGKKLLDIGTGNGMIPRLVLHYSDVESAVGIDPFLDGEHLSSWQVHDHGELFKQLAGFIDGHAAGGFRCESYAHLAGHMDYSIRPAPVDVRPQGQKKFRFEKIGAHDLGQLNETFDIFYAKAIDHIPDWPGIFKACAAAANDDALIVIKHFSFFSYLGPHRYATTNIPWGHLLLTDEEYRRFAREFHSDRAEAMIDFYFRGLAYPRNTMHQMVMMAAEHGFSMQAIINEPSRSVQKLLPLASEVPDFWSIVKHNHPTVTSEEMLSGRYHILFRKAD